MKDPVLFPPVLLTLLVLLALAPGVADAQETEIDRVADHYLAAVEAQDFDAMAELLAEDAAYVDRTMQYFDRPSIDLAGPEAILEFWRAGSEDSETSEIRYDLRNRFRAGPVVVYEIRASVTVGGAFWGLQRDEITFVADQVMIVEVRDGRVIRHEDHVDYGAVIAQLQEARRQEQQAR